MMMAHLAAAAAGRRCAVASQDAPGARAGAGQGLAFVRRLLDARQRLAEPGPAVAGGLHLRGCRVQLVRQVLWMTDVLVFFFPPNIFDSIW